jgi:ribosomal protein L7/L12
MGTMSDNEQKSGELPDAAIAALTNGRKIEAVKILRREWNIDLKEAKDTVDKYLSSINSSQVARRATKIETGIGRLLLLVFIVIAIGYYMWTKF